MTCAPFIALAVAVAPVLARDRTITQYTSVQHDVTLKISAPRADIIRIQIGKGSLHEDASWAVLPYVRAQNVPLEVSESGDVVELRTAALSVSVDRVTLAMTIRDARGAIVLADAPKGAIRFAEGGFSLRKVMPSDMHYFGLGDKTGPLDRRGGVYTLWNSDQFGFGTATDPLYKSIPFILGVDDRGRAFGLFMDNSWRSVFDFGKGERAIFSFGAEGGPIDYYVMAGPTPKQVVQDYAWLTGTAPLTPRWALGFQQSRWSYMSQAEAQAIADRLRRDRIPADVLWLDIDYQDRNRPFTVNTATFPDLPGLVRTLRSQDLHLVVITDLHIAQAPNQGYTPYDSGIARDVFMKNPDGNPFIGPVWPGPALFPDFTQARVRDWWGEQYRDFVKMGIAGFWNDMNEPAVFDPAKTIPLDVINVVDEPGFALRKTTQAEAHNLTGMLNARATYEGLLKLAPTKRPFVMTRASFAGGQRYGATWTGDNSSSWAQLKLSVSQLVSLGLSGFAYAGDDIGGFAGDPPSPDLLTRWIELGAFNPIFRDHYQKGKAAQEVWVHGTAHEEIRRRYIEERYRLMPYIYALAEQNSRSGVPLMRPVFLEYPWVVGNGDHLGGTEDQFMLGGDLLIAPPTTWESLAPYKITLPGAGWYDYWTGLPLASTETTETPALDRLPVFVRPGTILPRQPLVQSTAETPKGRLQLAVYPGADCQGMLYLDDGESLAYHAGDYLRQHVACDATTLSFGAREGRFRPWWSGFDVVIHGWVAPVPKVRFAGRTIAATVDPASHTLSFVLPDIARPARVVIGG